MEDSTPIKKFPTRIDRNRVASTKINLIFNLPEFVDLEYLKERLKYYDLKEVEIFEKQELEGLISIPVKELDIKEAVREAKNIIAEPIKDAIVHSGFADKIKNEVKEKKSMQAFIKWVKSTHTELNFNKVTNQEIRSKVEDRYADLFGDKGVDVIVNLFSQDEEHILNNWAKLEDFFMKKLALEFYIFQQIREASFIILTVRSNDEEVKSLIMNSEKILIPITEDIEFYKRKISLPNGKTINNIFTHQRLEKVLMIFNPSKSIYSFVQRLLALRKTNSDLSFMTFMIEKQNEVLNQDLKDFQFDIEYLKNQAIDLDPKTLSYTIESLRHLIDMIYFTHEDYIKPCKKVSENLLKKRKLISQKEYKRHFQEVVTIDNIKAVIQPQEWMLDLLPEYNITKTDKLLSESEKLSLDLLKLLRELREQLLEYKKAKEENNKNKLIKIGETIVKILWELAKIKMRFP